MDLWKMKREKPAFLALADGSIFRGWSFGAPKDLPGEAVFNTGMTGYQEILTDPSYAGEFVVLTAPEIGNYGCNPDDDESRGIFLNGLLVHELNPPSNYRSVIALDALLRERGVPALAGIDTRQLTLKLRDNGCQKAYLHASDTPLAEDDAVDLARSWEGLDGRDSVSRVTSGEPFEWNREGKYHIVALDFGIKYNILRNLAAHDMRVTVVPAHTAAERILALKPDGVFLSNGPGDPAGLPYAAAAVRGLLGKTPLMGICLGCQLLGLAAGGRTIRLKFGHHGCNHPVRNLATGRVEITSQNHNFALAPESLPAALEVTHINLNDNTVEGIRHRTEPAFAVQYHPEAAPGPHDAEYLFMQFQQLLER